MPVPTGIKIAEEIATRESVDPVALSIPLYDVIDVDALETLTNVAGFRQHGMDLRVEFMYYGYAVTVYGNGSVVIDDHRTDARPNGATSAVAEGARETMSDGRSRRENALNRAFDIVADTDRSFDERVESLLEVGRIAVGTDYATLSYVNNDKYVFEAVDVPTNVDLQAGTMVPLGELPNCQTVAETEQALVLEDVEAEAPELADPTWGISSYIGVPVCVDGEVYGTFCFYGLDERAEGFSEWDLTFVELLGDWVSGELEQRERARTISARALAQQC